MTDDSQGEDGTARRSVCFVCLGNICRSPTAEGVFRRKAEQRGLLARLVVDSAGTAAYHQGEPADRRSRSFAHQRGYELASIARQFKADDFGRFDYVLAMDRENLENLERLSQSTGLKSRHLGLFRDFDRAASPGSSVPDPYYCGDAGFVEVLDQCERAAEGLLDVLERELS